MIGETEYSKGSVRRPQNHDRYRDNFDGINWGKQPKCRRCGATLKPGVALQQTWVAGMPDFPGDDENSPGQTMCCGGPGELVSCHKCPECGHSTT